MFPDGDGYTNVTSACPRQIVTQESVFLLSLYRHYKAGHLYESGGVSNQPARYLMAMQLIEGALNADHSG